MLWPTASQKNLAKNYKIINITQNFRFTKKSILSRKNRSEKNGLFNNSSIYFQTILKI